MASPMFFASFKIKFFRFRSIMETSTNSHHHNSNKRKRSREGWSGNPNVATRTSNLVRLQAWGPHRWFQMTDNIMTSYRPYRSSALYEELVPHASHYGHWLSSPSFWKDDPRINVNMLRVKKVHEGASSYSATCQMLSIDTPTYAVFGWFLREVDSR